MLRIASTSAAPRSPAGRPSVWLPFVDFTNHAPCVCQISTNLLLQRFSRSIETLDTLSTAQRLRARRCIRCGARRSISNRPSSIYMCLLIFRPFPIALKPTIRGSCLPSKPFSESVRRIQPCHACRQLRNGTPTPQNEPRCKASAPQKSTTALQLCPQTGLGRYFYCRRSPVRDGRFSTFSTATNGIWTDSDNGMVAVHASADVQ